jgi:hypothetical protein
MPQSIRSSDKICPSVSKTDGHILSLTRNILYLISYMTLCQLYFVFIYYLLLNFKMCSLKMFLYVLF